MAESTIKCVSCGLTNFRTADRCKRCKSELSPSLTGKSDKKTALEKSPTPAGSKVRLALSSGVMLAVLIGLVVFYLRQGPQAVPEASDPSSGTQAASLQPQPEAKDSIRQNPESAEAGLKVLRNLKRFQDATENDLSYAEYDEMLNELDAYLNNTLPAFEGHSPGDETFRREAAAAVRDYAAARNWWQTTVKHSNVFKDADRDEQLKADWTSAKTHIENAEKAMAR
jgi:hypothetical protein